MKKRLNRSERNAQNRAEILKTASRKFLQHGYHGASVDTIAEAAGFTKGAVYSRFASKDDLFLALLERRIERRHEQSRKIAAGLAGTDGLLRVVAAAVGTSTASHAWQLLLLEFRTHAERDVVLSRRYAQLHQLALEHIAALITELYDRAAEPPPMPASELALTLMALGTGLAAEVALNPDIDAEGIAVRIVRALAHAQCPPAAALPADATDLRSPDATVT